MEFCIFTEPQQGYTYDELLASALAAEALGFDGWFRSDHYLAMDGIWTGGPGGTPGPTDAWTTLAGLARDTTTLRLGTLVSSVTYRYPGVLAIQVAQVDQMSGGRAELGLGTGWFAEEHAQYGIPFPEKRFGMLDEQLQIVTSLWSTPIGSTFDFAGSHYTLTRSSALPKPTQARIPLIVGGNGAKRTPELAARYATEFNIGFVDDAGVSAAFDRVRSAASAIQRDPSDLRYSVAQPIAVGRTEAEFVARAKRNGADPAQLRSQNLGGTVDEVVDRLGRLRELGADRVYLQLFDLFDADHLALIAEITAPFK
ncbi:TIGR03560 family F420-dependent LLM class oxidoreductase [Naasia lichenicola]|uniref:TIGR03560 family F420-dependent LLM class oxidoreductase n=1 Tax=Naasia lichenicola TaxID=2565933 RepID=A0A4S4FHT5_9MICO|nr:TIGR03560 family F420-dependent LLM class oxidoreductase [Naasia lichenicola]THG28616.1 TIGR03560 family F420-dependent LLM class oxidoreductase [Naasia lichenicola]